MSGDEDEGVAADLSAMEAEFLEIDENGRWNVVYQVGPLPGSKWKWQPEAERFRKLK